MLCCVKSDCLAAINKLSCTKEGGLSNDVVVGDCLELGKKFQSLQFELVRRSGNRVAHALARLVLIAEFSVSTFWHNDVHASVMSLIVQDLQS